MEKVRRGATAAVAAIALIALIVGTPISAKPTSNADDPAPSLIQTVIGAVLSWFEADEEVDSVEEPPSDETGPYPIPSG